MSSPDNQPSPPSGRGLPPKLPRQRDIGNPADFLPGSGKAETESASGTGARQTPKAAGSGSSLPTPRRPLGLSGLLGRYKEKAAGARDKVVGARKTQKRDVIPPGVNSVSMPELSLRPAQMLGAFPPAPKAKVQQASPPRPPVSQAATTPRDSATPVSEAPPRPRPSSPGARRPPGLEAFRPPQPQAPQPPSAAERAAAPPPRPPAPRPAPPRPTQGRQAKAAPVPRRLAKQLPKSAGTASAPAPRPRPAAAPAPSLQRQLDQELYGILRKSAQFLRWNLPQFPRAMWRAIPGRRLLLAGAGLVALAVVAPQTPLNRWSATALDSLAQNMKSRAAFQVIDDFTGGIAEHWSPTGLVSDAGAARVTGFALNRNTMQLAGYRLDFDARIASRGLGWVIGAADDRNYYAFKLEEVRSRQETKYRLVRYLVSEGEVAESDRVQVDVPFSLDSEAFNRISVRLKDNRIATFINGTGVDYWQAEETPQGGVGFFTEGTETAYVRRVEVTGNEDTWGLFLFGFLELLEDAKGFVEPVTAQFDSTPPKSSGAETPSESRLASAF